MSLKFSIYFLTRFFVTVVAIIILQIAFIPSVFAVDNGCSNAFPTCLINTGGSSWNCKTVSSCSVEGNPEDFIQLTGTSCCNIKPINTATECGTTKDNSTGQLVCSTPGGDIPIDTSLSNANGWVWCGQALTGNPCCLNTNNNGNARCTKLNSVPSAPSSFDICAQTGNNADCAKCRNQVPPGVWTAVGCVTTTKEGITSSVIKLGLGIGGGVVLLMILAASFKLTTSKGDPKATEEAKEMITNAIGGLLFILFSVVLIRTIGRGLLQIPGF